MESNIIPIYSDVMSIRLTPDQKQLIEDAAQKARMSPSEWARKQMVEATEPAPEERRRLLVITISNEILRLTLVAMQDQEDVSSDNIRQRIEREARAMAEATLDRWLNQKGAA